MNARFCFVAIAVVTLAAGVARAEPAYYAVPLRGLKLVDGQLPKSTTTGDFQNTHRRTKARADLYPRIAVDGGAEAYLKYQRGSYSPWIEPRELFNGMTVHARGPRAKDVTGHLYLPAPDERKMVALRFVIPADTADPAEEKSFFEAKEAHYQALRDRDIPGTSWFRHQEIAARKSQKPSADHQAGEQRVPAALQSDNWQRRSELDRTYALFTGGRAVSENLQLDRVLPPGGEDVEKVPLDTIRGITVDEFDWNTLDTGPEPKADHLAKYVPADQHVVFFPSFAAAARVADEAKAQGMPILQLAQPRAEDTLVQTRYERQLGCSMSAAARLLGPHLVKSIALTGSDPYYRTGTDVAVLLESDRPEVLAKALTAQVALAAVGVPEAKASTGQIDGIKYQVVRSPDRAISSYLTVLDDAVVLANSPHQLKRLAEVRAGSSPSIATTGEYRFFRRRYPLGDRDETALVVITDATIRRWCGPRWRIATSRRTRAAAVLAEVQASQIDALVDQKSPAGPIYTDLPLAEGEKLSLTPAGVASSTQGTLAFLTPIAEIPLTEVTKAETEAYERWRDGYESYWNVGFDPIGFRITIDDRRLAGDLTVMPLIAATRYRDMIDVTAGGAIKPGSGDPHDALVQIVLAIDPKSSHFRSADTMLGSMKAGLGLGWLGDSVSVYLDDTPFWKDLEALVGGDEKLENFMQHNYHRVPVGLHAEVAGGFQLAGFLAAGRAWLEQTAPGMARWETIEHDGQTYVKVVPTDKARGRGRDAVDWAVYYAASGNGLDVALDENVLRRALARQKKRHESDSATGEPSPEGEADTAPDARPWLGKNLALRADRRLLAVVNALSAEHYQRTMQRQAWNNLPILNQWHRRWPGADPVEIHQRVWGARLVCPGGGRYVWNPQWQTMESTVYGHPGQPKQGPVAPPLLGRFHNADFGLSFENKGLRARVELDRD